MLFWGLLLIGALSIGAMGFRLRKPTERPVMHAGLLMRFALLPGERHGVVWEAEHLSGAPMIATLTSTGVFALNYSVEQAPPVRMRPEGVSVTCGSPQAITTGAAEPMVDVTLFAPSDPPMSFRIARSGATALAAWAVPSA
ncbi:MAG: hypothetical protein HGA51_03090 [Demequinaceae bacterium]|nr:hypothetical protein [Demequinaceae bacterium]